MSSGTTFAKFRNKAACVRGVINLRKWLEFLFFERLEFNKKPIFFFVAAVGIVWLF